MRLLFAFLRRDLRIAASYKSNLLFTVGGAVVTLTAFYFLAHLVGSVPLGGLGHASDYFSFALLGVATAAALSTLQSSFAKKLRESQLDGSLEPLLATPRSTFALIAAMAAYPSLMAVVRALVLIAAGAWLFGARLSISPLGFGLTFALSLLAFAPLGLLSAAFVLVAKRGDPFSYLLDAASYLLSGVIYPVSVLPHWLRMAADLLPCTWALEGLRAAGLGHADIRQLLPTWGALLLFSAVLWPASAWALHAARSHIERTGTLPQL